LTRFALLIYHLLKIIPDNEKSIDWINILIFDSRTQI
jgi:hypothetical protein